MIDGNEELKPSREPAMRAERPAPRVAQFYVFRGDQYLGWDCFEQGEVVLGSGDGADLVLAGAQVAEAQVLVECWGNRVHVRDLVGNGLVRINGRAVAEGPLGHLDVLTIGEYSIKVRSKPVRAPASEPRPAATAPEPPKSDPDVSFYDVGFRCILSP